MGIALAAVVILIARADGAQCNQLPHNECEQRLLSSRPMKANSVVRIL